MSCAFYDTFFIFLAAFPALGFCGCEKFSHACPGQIRSPPANSTGNTTKNAVQINEFWRHFKPGHVFFLESCHLGYPFPKHPQNCAWWPLYAVPVWHRFPPAAVGLVPLHLPSLPQKADFGKLFRGSQNFQNFHQSSWWSHTIHLLWFAEIRGKPTGTSFPPHLAQHQLCLHCLISRLVHVLPTCSFGATK